MVNSDLMNEKRVYKYYKMADGMLICTDNYRRID